MLDRLTTFCLGVLTLTVSGGWASDSINCGQPKIVHSHQRVVNGYEAKPGSWPWVVLLMEMNTPVCSGTIINERIIMTAAHCFDDPISRDIRRWQVIAGKHHVDHYDNTQHSFSIKKLLLHEAYDSRTVINDIALIELQGTLTFTDFILPVCLPNSSAPPTVGKTCYLAGWGDTLGTGKDTVLNQVALPIISDRTCSRPDWYGAEFTPATMLCAGYEQGGRDACSGDSGSPLSCKHGDSWFAQGIASWGYGCAEPKWPGLYTEVYQYVPWILKHSHSMERIVG